MSKLVIEDINVKGKRVLVRVDFNVPINRGHVLNDKRIRSAIPTILYLIKRGAKVVLISHLGRPNGEKVSKLSLKPCAKILSNLLGKSVIFSEECVGIKAEKMVNRLKNGQVILLENLRFHKEEVQNCKFFAKKLAAFSDLYVNDAFGTMHRKHASTEGVTHFIDNCAMGFLVKKEVNYIENVVKKPSHLFVAVLGGSKIFDKISIINNLISKVDMLIIGGGMVYTFLKAKGLEIGKSLFEPSAIPFVRNVLDNFEDKLLLPIDCLVTDFFNKDTQTIGKSKYVNIDSIEKGWYGIDIGEKTIFKFSSFLRSSKTIIWNGPLGAFEIEQASAGTFIVAKAIGEATQNGAVTIIGGGDSILAIERAGVINKISHISTGGGAALSLIGGKSLPGLEALTDSY